MILLTVNELRKYFGPEPVLDGVTFDIRPGERIGLVGPNGTGKSTLLRIVAGLEEATGGSVTLHSSARLGYLEQQPEFPAEKTLREIARDALSELLELAARAEAVAHDLAAAQDETTRARLGAQFDRLQHELQRRDAYQLDHRLDRVLTGLGFEPGQYDQPVRTLSGGQQNRLLLARLLLQQPDLMLLDEPSNHLDIEATEWLENFLASSQQAILLVSHDRYFLDKVTTRTLELFHGTVESYTGNFSAYWRQKAERVEVQRRTWERQQEEIAKLKDFIRRNSYGQKSAQAEDRRKKLERIVPVPPPREIAMPPMGFPPASRTGDIVLRVEHLSKGFEYPLFSDLSFDLLRGERWGILGPNGSGKTTLLRCLMGIHRPDSGNVILGAGVVPGYFDQLLSFDDPGALVVDAVRPSHKEFIEQQRRDLLARFGITGDMVFQPVASLSGGERNRVALARLAASDANFLLLDEPTNHLDLWARDALERALKKFEGTLLFVSHDRYFLNQVADHLLVVEPGRFRVIEGGYDTYLHLARGGAAAASAAPSANGAPPAEAGRSEPGKGGAGKSEPARGETTRSGAGPKRKRKFPYRKVEELEAEIARVEERIDQLHQLLASPEILRDGGAVKRTRTELEEQEGRLAHLLEHWEEASELN